MIFSKIAVVEKRDDADISFAERFFQHAHVIDSFVARDFDEIVPSLPAKQSTIRFEPFH